MDAAGFEAMYHEHEKLVLGFLTTQTRNRALAEDLAGETWLRAWRAIQRGVEPETPGAWLITIAKRLWIDHQRKIEFGRTVSLDGLWEDLSNDLSDWLTDPHDVIEATINRLDAAFVGLHLAALSDRQRLVVWLWHVEDCEMEELMEVLDCKRGAAKQVVIRGIARLRERIAV